MWHGQADEDCRRIAAQIARKLLQGSAQPYIMRVLGEPTDRIGGTGPIRPRLYSGAVSWGYHILCCEAALVFDPLVGEIVGKEEYVTQAFLDPVRLWMHTPARIINSFLKTVYE